LSPESQNQMNFQKGMTVINSDDVVLKRAREAWHEPFSGFTVYDLIHAKGSPFEALLYANLLWPAFARVDDMTFLPFVVEDDDDRTRILKRFEVLNDKTQVEREFNLTEVASLFGRRRAETTVEEDDLLARYLAEIWASKLKAEFPARLFDVRVVESSSDMEIAVTLYEQR
jgi:hypothetical protein